jgi:phosphatidylserine/phosphatidylglycerophosphate/cardiolipin synthase-like enzyme
MRRSARRLGLAAVLAAWAGTAWHEAAKPLPEGLHVASGVCRAPAGGVSFIADITAADAFGRTVVSQGIFDAVLGLVRGAHRFIVLDYGGFGAETGPSGGPAAGAAATAPPERRLAAEIADALIAQRRAQPDLRVLLVTDPASEGYGAAPSLELALLRAAGVEVVVADLDRLRDSNLAYSSAWRLALRWWARPPGSLGVATRRLNFKADERKVIIADDGGTGLAAVIGSADPEDRESIWSNLAARVTGASLEPLLESELAVARFSGWRGDRAALEAAAAAAAATATAECRAGGVGGDGHAAAHAPPGPDTAAGGVGEGAAVQLLTEGAIGQALITRLDATLRGEAIDVAMFHLADRAVLESLLAAARRGVAVRLILDPNDTGSSGGATGLPNQPMASDLVARSSGALHVRWYRTHGERFHDGLVMIYGAERMWLTLGSAQLTRRALEDYNLEANVALESARRGALAEQALGYFDTLWANRAGLGIEYTADFAVFADPAQSDYWLCRLLEGVGLTPY